MNSIRPKWVKTLPMANMLGMSPIALLRKAQKDRDGAEKDEKDAEEDGEKVTKSQEVAQKQLVKRLNFYLKQNFQLFYLELE